MTAVTVVVPWRGGDAWRERAWLHMQQWWAQQHPGWQVITTAAGHNDGEWCKATAVAAALPRAEGEVLVVADADVLCAGVGPAVNAVADGWPWGVPHTAVYRLTPVATARLYEYGTLPDLTGPRSLLRGTVAEVHRGVQGGGLVVLPRAAWDRCPLDARFRGWGQEDLAWGWALSRMLGAPFRTPDPLVHLWHPPQDRRSRTAGSQANVQLWNRYRRAYSAAEVVALLDEPGARPSPVIDGQ